MSNETWPTNGAPQDSQPTQWIPAQPAAPYSPDAHTPAANNAAPEIEHADVAGGETESSGGVDDPFLAMQETFWETEPPAALLIDKSKRPLWIAVAIAAVVLALLAGLFLGRIFSESRNVVEAGRNVGAGKATVTPKETTQAEPTQTPSPTAITEAASTKVFADLATNTTCNAAADFATIKEAIAADTASNATAARDAALKDTLTKLSAKCKAAYTTTLTSSLAGLAETSSYSTNHAWWAKAAPAATPALDTPEFTTAARNIRCIFGSDNVECSIYTYDYPSPDGCEGYTATYGVNNTDTVVAGCEYAIDSSAVVDYGTTIHHGDFWCTTDATEGVQCRSELTGHGFRLRRAAAETF